MFEVALRNRDVANAVITVTFEGPSGRCGEVFVPDLTFVGGHNESVSTSTPIFMTYEPEWDDDVAIVKYCDVPTTTERLVVQLWDRGGGPGSAAAPLLRQEFNYTYVFASRS